MHTLMIVDDEFNIRDGLIHAVPWASIGVEVVAEAQDGVEALERALAVGPDLVLTDISMDEGDGLDFAEALLAARPRTKVIILSGYGEFRYAQRALDLKVWAYLLKPVGPDELLAKVAEAALALGEGSGEGLGASPVTEGASPARAVIRRAEAYLEDHFGDHETSLEALADHLGLTPAYLSKLFKAETGRNYSEALADLRIERAKGLLRHTGLRAAEVGARVGYPNPQYFATTFKKATGLSPSEYRDS